MHFHHFSFFVLDVQLERWSKEAAFAGAARDSIWYKAVIPDAIPPDPSQPLPSSQVLQAEVEDYVQHRFSWAAPPIWLTPAGRVAEEGSGSVLLSFSREEDLEYVLRNGVFLFGRALRVRRFRDSGRPRPAPTAAVWSTRRVPAPSPLAAACVLE
ncbi:hypothetical protein AURDEDRAFT_178638, partial [Auricularia subglabra TFB-10046 SS5]